MSHDPLDVLLITLDQAFDRGSWHGPNLRGSLRGVSRSQALWRPHRDRHSIWEQSLHCAYWKYTIRRRILGEKRGSFPLKGSNWFEPIETTEAAWREAIKLLVSTHQSMRKAIEGLRGTSLHRKAPGSKSTFIHLISGIAAHDVYHAGQIQLLKRLQDK